MAAEGASPTEVAAGSDTAQNRLLMRTYMARLGGVAVDNCDKVRVRGGLGWQWPPGFSRCPAGRSGAAAWRGNHPGSFRPKALNFASAKTPILAEGRAMPGAR